LGPYRKIAPIAKYNNFFILGTNLYTKYEAKKMILQIHALQNLG
jgi:hypothetical protein